MLTGVSGIVILHVSLVVSPALKNNKSASIVNQLDFKITLVGKGGATRQRKKHRNAMDAIFVLVLGGNFFGLPLQDVFFWKIVCHQQGHCH